MKKIELTRGYKVMVDDEDFDYLNQWDWNIFVKPNRIVGARRTYIEKGTHLQKTVYMHRLIMKAEAGEQIDHINRNTLDNRKTNLRFCTGSENQANRAPFNKIGVKGVYLFKPTGKWKAQIRNKGKVTGLGYFDDINDAAKAYNNAAVKFHGEFAYLNKLPIKI